MSSFSTSALTAGPLLKPPSSLRAIVMNQNDSQLSQISTYPEAAMWSRSQPGRGHGAIATVAHGRKGQKWDIAQLTDFGNPVQLGPEPGGNLLPLCLYLWISADQIPSGHLTVHPELINPPKVQQCPHGHSREHLMSVRYWGFSPCPYKPTAQ